MKKLLILTGIFIWGTAVHAQFLDRIKNKVQQKVNEKVDKKIDETIDKATAPQKKNAPPAEHPEAGAPAVNNGTPAAGGGINTNITSYSRFDFVPGEKIIVAENFAQDPVGEFPGQWNTHSGAELVTVSNRPGKWLNIRQDGVFYPEYLTGNLPENFTLQLDIMANDEIASISYLVIGLINAGNTDEKFSRAPGLGLSTEAQGFKIQLTPKSSGHGDFGYASHVIGSHSTGSLPEFHVPEKNSVRLSVWRQKQRVRVYLDSTKVLDLPKALDPGTILNSLVFSTYAPAFDDNNGGYFISNITLAVGAPDTRNKLITEGKFTTHGILFDTNSDRIKAESYGALKDIANVLTENPSVRVKIIGHTDADGSDQANLELSRHRAAAVKAALSKDFNIDGSRMETDGKGKSQPADNNNTEVGKANNRRVEFVKM
ncbi:OmpA family protein [Chitinophaga solisilvae]|uniref:OmpA family protein n=1 Tax=Chitinophaga solisilvae TaxID=1233460 RepID=UPI001371292A|nr:OmpA family protein [Chitinophaga solisilvae]